MSKRKYKDQNGEEVTLMELCRRDPAWASSRIFWLGEEVTRLTDEVEGFVKSTEEDRARLLDAMHRLDRIGFLASGEAE